MTEERVMMVIVRCVKSGDGGKQKGSKDQKSQSSVSVEFVFEGGKRGPASKL